MPNRPRIQFAMPFDHNRLNYICLSSGSKVHELER